VRCYEIDRAAETTAVTMARHRRVIRFAFHGVSSQRASVFHPRSKIIATSGSYFLPNLSIGIVVVVVVVGRAIVTAVVSAALSIS